MAILPGAAIGFLFGVAQIKLLQGLQSGQILLTDNQFVYLNLVVSKVDDIAPLFLKYTIITL